MSELATWRGASDACDSQSACGSDVASMDPEENALSVGQEMTGGESSPRRSFSCSCFQCGKHDDRTCVRFPVQ